ncbi:MAG TPA: SGNH/GDSL hydrolase family protein, partial [Gemmatimonadales bacterium]|nr:SGNH/GDSL hydrolase family protein [Gemmatimonadales bacterium]
DRNAIGPNDARGLGAGYPFLLAAGLGDRHPDRDWQVYNRGVSGNTVLDLRGRWDSDTIALHPDVLSILIGVNDYWHTRTGAYQGTAESYESGYTALMAKTRDALPNTKLVVMEPFVLVEGAVSQEWFPEFDHYRAAAARVAKGAAATFVPLHEMFQSLAAKSGAAHWLVDGVHPTLAGHDAIARQWLDTVAF